LFLVNLSLNLRQFCGVISSTVFKERFLIILLLLMIVIF